MNGKMMYEIARQRSAERQQAARRAAEAREVRRGRHAKSEAQEPPVPAIPDYAHEMFGAVPAPREETGQGRHTRRSR